MKNSCNCAQRTPDQVVSKGVMQGRPDNTDTWQLILKFCVNLQNLWKLSSTKQVAFFLQNRQKLDVDTIYCNEVLWSQSEEQEDGILTKNGT